MRFGGSSKSKSKSKNKKSDKAAQNGNVANDNDDSNGTTTPIYYFGYGAMVNPIARQRRGVSTDEAHAALLPNYRLTFSYGGAANIVQKTGFEVYGIVMKCSTENDWNILKDFDAGYDCVEVDVYPLKQKDYDCCGGNDEDSSGSIPEEEEGFAQVQDTPIRARVFVLPKDQLSKGPDPDKIPQERYLKVIASGMKAYGVDPDYINDEIMGVEFIPSRKPADYLTFPTATMTSDLPTLSLQAWNKECQKRLHKAAKKKTNLSLFRIGQHAIQVDDANPNNPFCVWLRDRLEGPQDSTWVIVQTLFDPDLPLIASPNEVTAVHQRWAENQMMEKFQQAGVVQATTIFQVLQLTPNDKPTIQPQRRGQGRFQSAMQSSLSSFRSKKSKNTNATATTTTTTSPTAQQQQRPSATSTLAASHEAEEQTTTQPAVSPTTTSSRLLVPSKMRSIIRRSKLPSLRGSSTTSSHNSGGTNSNTTKKSNSKNHQNNNNHNEPSNSATSVDMVSPSVLAIQDHHHHHDDYDDYDDDDDNNNNSTSGSCHYCCHQQHQDTGTALGHELITASANDDDDDDDDDGPPISSLAFSPPPHVTTTTS